MFQLVRYSRWASRFDKLQPRNYCTTITTNPTESNTEQAQTRPSPPPIQVSLTESADRGVFATRRIGAGELIHTANPILTYPSLSLLHRVCYFCLKNVQNKKSTASIVYCSDECEHQSKVFYEVDKKADWSTFNDYCKMQGLKYPLLVKRLACMVISGVASANSLELLQPAILSSHMVSLMEKEFSLLRNAFVNADIMEEQIEFLTLKWYADVLARIRINAFRVEVIGGSSYEDLLLSAAASVEAESAVGNAVYILASLYNHDCDPNAHILWIENANAKFKALRDIEPGEELRICYIDASMDYDARQKILYEGFGFRCKCPRCLSND